MVDTMVHTEQDDYWMRRALALAEQGREQGEVPVGAVLVRDGEVLGEGWNQPIGCSDPTAHAEIIALRQAASRLNNYRLPGSSLYVTLEPCTMCVGAMIHARVERLIYGTTEPKAGVVESQSRLLEQDFYNHRLSVTSGVLAQQCRQQLTSFFRERRETIKSRKKDAAGS
ncbi:tRNA adenosine(34) deaminase TadA [Marinimicrobium sp. ABcell2]|uniref:tRNA adenosine(34) deaminase TadA n=1 Tax=Marinimicrobium sp. ABcell2 TaxID=3069751 RepID=UPI0027B24B79|nr:tRNA adenosine(34) deaminase TadA [Marinimicrobium sp. ABcell2]MDQ2075361.1 tRNA adenosine(34) deaminase TadA [Marinimicrobium sp. ABcell2]